MKLSVFLSWLWRLVISLYLIVCRVECSEYESEEEIDRGRTPSYFGSNFRRPFNVWPPLTPTASLSFLVPDSRFTQVIPGKLSFQKTIEDADDFSTVFTSAQPAESFTPRRPIILKQQQHIQHEETYVSNVVTSNCPQSASCLPLVYCAPFFDEVRANDLGCHFHENAEGACCRAPQRLRGSGFSSFDGGALAVFSPRAEVGAFSTSELSKALFEGITFLKIEDERAIELRRKGIEVSNPQRPAYGHLQFFKTTPKAVALSRNAVVQVVVSKAVRRRSKPGSYNHYGFMTNPQLLGFGGHRGIAETEDVRRFSASDTELGPSCPAPPDCTGKKKKYYRTSDGSCNNIYNPDWGRARTTFSRLLPPRYGDGIDSPRLSVSGGNLPSARVVSTANVPDVDNPSPEFTLAVMQWGQFIDHDLTHAPIFRFDNESGVECCNSRGQLLSQNLRLESCFPISIPSGDPFFAKFGRRCMNFVRSLPATLRNCSYGYREQMNQVSHFLDGSAVYGSSDEEERGLREGFGGLLKTQGKGLLPPDNNAREEDCFAEPSAGLRCFHAGDSRVNEQPQLSVIHTIWVRQHNRIARKLSKLNPHWSDETIFQETRKIVAAQIQHIVYNEWLPLILGTSTVENEGLLPLRNGFTNSYDKNVDASILNEFATVAFRFGHTLVQGMVSMFDKYHRNTEQIDLSDHFNRPGLLYQSKRFDQLLRGLSKQPMQSFDNFVVDDLTNRLFQTEKMPFGMDLVALNLQRGRDHGIPSYNELREVCGLPRARTFNDLRDHLRPQSVEIFRQLYESVDDIDPFVAGISEVPYRGGILGPTFNCIIRNQFARLKFGDRFFYENGDMYSSFTEAQLHEIRKTSWAGIICGNSEYITKIQPLAFRLPGPHNEKVPCSSPAIPKLDCRPWISAPQGHHS